jgi:hypothetical protein
MFPGIGVSPSHVETIKRPKTDFSFPREVGLSGRGRTWRRMRCLTSARVRSRPRPRPLALEWVPLRTRADALMLLHVCAQSAPCTKGRIWFLSTTRWETSSAAAPSQSCAWPRRAPTSDPMPSSSFPRSPPDSNYFPPGGSNILHSETSVSCALPSDKQACPPCFLGVEQFQEEFTRERDLNSQNDLARALHAPVWSLR